MNKFKSISLALSLAAAVIAAAAIPALGQTTTLNCTPAFATVAPGQSVNFNVTGGNGTFSFAGNGVTATTTTNSVLPVSFSTIGTNTFTVSSGGQTANCSVNVQSATGSLTCTPATSVVAPGQSVNFLIAGGNGTFSFAGNGIVSTTTTNTVFPTNFSSTGLNTFTVSSGGQTANCSVNVQNNAGIPSPTVVTCMNPTGPVFAGQPAVFTAAGGNGTFTFSSPSLTITNPIGTSFTADFANPGVQTVSATSNGVSATCAVNVLPATANTGVTTLSCSPVSQTGTLGQTVNFTAAGGDGNYVWSATDLRLINPTGNGFRAAYGNAGLHTVTVSSAGQTATCAVTVLPLSTPGLPNTGFAPVN